jgi:hypothetical protein
MAIVSSRLAALALTLAAVLAALLQPGDADAGVPSWHPRHHRHRQQQRQQRPELPEEKKRPLPEGDALQGGRRAEESVRRPRDEKNPPWHRRHARPRSPTATGRDARPKPPRAPAGRRSSESGTPGTGTGTPPTSPTLPTTPSPPRSCPLVDVSEDANLDAVAAAMGDAADIVLVATDERGAEFLANVILNLASVGVAAVVTLGIDRGACERVMREYPAVVTCCVYTSYLHASPGLRAWGMDPKAVEVLWLIRYKVVRDLVARGQSVLMTDSDMWYARDPFPVLRGELLGAHSVVANTEAGLYRFNAVGLYSLKAPGLNPEPVQ